jgi:cobalt-zinc-cadmium efflux system outer membrane protein
LIGATKSMAQRDTLVMSLQQVEKQFIDSNLLLIASQYNVDANKALIEQAKLWDNPTIATDQNVYTNNKFFQHGNDANGQPNGQYFIQWQQLIKTARKRGKSIDLAKSNARISELQMDDLLRNLKYQLRQDYYTIENLLKTKNIIEQQIKEFNSLFDGALKQFAVGNISEKEKLRIQSIKISLEQELVDVVKQIIDNENELKTLMGVKNSVFIAPQITKKEMTLNIDNKDAVFATAKTNNAYYLLLKEQNNNQIKNLSLQKALAIPDITLGPEYDHNSNYTPHYVGIGINFPLPIFNRNQGNIKSASFNVKQANSLAQNAEVELYNNISAAYDKLVSSIQLNNKEEQEFISKYQNIYQKVFESYKSKQINLIEFLDFYDSFKSAIENHFNILLNSHLAVQEINYHAGTDVVKQ